MDNYAFNTQLPLWSFQFKSSSKVQIISRKDIETSLIAKALKDDGFRTDLITDPAAKIRQMFDLSLPEKLTISVLEEKEDLIYLIIPHNPYTGIAETELQSGLGMGLEEVAAWVMDQQQRGLTEDKGKDARIIAQAWRNGEFKKLLIADPVLVLEEAAGDNNITVKVLEETAEDIYIVIPAIPDSLSELEDIDINTVNIPLVIGSKKPSSFLQAQNSNFCLCC